MNQRIDRYDPQSIEPKWQRYWYDEHPELFQAREGSADPKYYVLIEFPYPSGEGLHVGHPRSFTAMDIIARKRRAQGYNVLYPIGFDAFGLPAENYALKTGIHPRLTTEHNIANFTRQLKSLGYSFDWSRAVDTTKPEYYKWTQWIFAQLFKHGLAYKTTTQINYCTHDKVALANEEVIDGKCERCGHEVIKKEKDQWLLRITDYADRLVHDLDAVNFLERIKTQQRNWIGRSEGAEITFKLNVPGQGLGQHSVTVFTTRPDTIYGVTFLAISPELAQKWIDVGWQATDEAKKYITAELALRQAADFDSEKEKTGVATSVMAINPLSGEEVPVWIVNYVLGTVGTGAIMGVPAHDERDYEFAQKYSIAIQNVIHPDHISITEIRHIDQEEVSTTQALSKKNDRILSGREVWVGEGKMCNSGLLNGLSSHEARIKTINIIENNGFGRRATTYKLRDWVFSRQRYWGEPIPLVHCDACAAKKQKALLIHGFEGSGETNWLPWLKSELERRGFEVFAPTMSTSAHPSVESWIEELLPYVQRLDADDIVVGHSLGAQAAMHLITQSNTKIGHLFLVGEVPLNPTPTQWRLVEERWDDARSDLAALKEFVEVKVNYQVVNELVGAATIMVSRDDFIIGPEVEALRSLVPAGWRYLIYEDQGHFTATTAPELLELVERTRVSGWRLVSDLPVVLPEVEEFRPGENGESPLANLDQWVNTICPHCGGPARRETDTMPQWAGSSWYFLRYVDPDNDQVLANPDRLKYWLSKSDATNDNGIDWYNGGMEHTTLHLLYSRFWHKFLYDIGIVPTLEPYAKRTSQGMILGEGGEKMSKSRGNVVNPDDIVASPQYGADTMRLYEMFMGPFDQAIPWDTKSIVGVRRFLEKVWRLYGNLDLTAKSSDVADSALHALIKKISSDIEAMQFNTAIAAMMEYCNDLGRAYDLTLTTAETFLKLLHPFAPFIAEELWSRLGHTESISREAWPVYDENKIIKTEVEYAVQVNGKVRATVTLPVDADEATVIAAAKGQTNVAKYLEGQTIKKTIFVPGRIVGFVV